MNRGNKHSAPLKQNYRLHNYDWSIRTCLVYQQEDEKKGFKQTKYADNLLIKYQ